MQTFIAGLLLAGVSATTVVAFKHPKGYARLFPFLIGAATILFLGVVLWHIAVEITWRNLEQYFVLDLLPNAEVTKEQLSLPYVWVGFWYLGVIAFLWANLKLPPFLQVADRNSPPRRREKTH